VGSESEAAVLSARQNVVVSAPGKLMIIGEYAVLEGAEAVVSAVTRRAFARRRSAVTGAPEAPAEAKAAYAHAVAAAGAVGDPSDTPAIDVSSLRAQNAKLGLGSSAAAAAAAAGFGFVERGHEIESVAARAKVFDAAMRGHRDISPQGSGADVAAAVYGGFLRFRRLGEAVDLAQVQWPSELRARIVWTGQEARTSTFLAKVAELASAQPSQYRRLRDNLGSQAESFVRSLTIGDLCGVLRSTAEYGQAMAELGRAAGIPIVTDTLNKVAEIAQDAGGAAKPSGAGGGDVALALFPDDKSDQRFVSMCLERNFTLLMIEMGAPGVSEEVASGRDEAKE
jgi:phosphomevalonate kinase